MIYLHSEQVGYVNCKIVETPCKTDGYAAYDFIVEDDGIGMSEEFLTHIFEAFVRESTSTITGIQGTGLGMAITKSLVDLMGGTINIESKLGEGTKVTIHFEFRIADDEFVDSKEEYETNLKLLEGKKVLLVEDNELNREIAKDILEDMGIVVDEAFDGTFAVEKIVNICDKNPENRYDFVLMDIQMPVMDGYKATEEIRRIKNKYAKSVPIIAMTANAFAEDKKRALEAGMNAHLAKPIDNMELINTIAELLK